MFINCHKFEILNEVNKGLKKKILPKDIFIYLLFTPQRAVREKVNFSGGW